MNKVTARDKARIKKRNRSLKHGSALNKELSCDIHIPYSRHLNETTIKTLGGTLIKIIRLEGFSFETSDQKQINKAQEKRNSMLYSISDNRYAVWSTLVRKKETRFPEGNFRDSFTRELNSKYQLAVSKKSMFVNEQYLSIIRQPPSTKIKRFADLIKTLRQKGDIEAQKISEKEALAELDEVTEKILFNLTAYNPKVLGIRESENGYVSEPLTFFSYLINGNHRNVLLSRTQINKSITTARPFFGKDAIELKGLSHQRLIGGLTIKEYSGTTKPSILDGLLKLPFEFVLTQSFTFKARKEALDEMKLQKTQLNQANDDAVSLMDELAIGIDDLGSGRICFGDHHFTLLCSAKNKRDLQKNLAAADNVLSDQGITAIREDIALETSFWAQLPANKSYISRKAGISSQNFSSFSSFHNYPSGNFDKNHWGPAITLLETISGSPFYFNFHVRDLGNATIIGPSGSGKTVLMTFLQAQCEKYGGIKRIYLDKDRGAEIFIRAINGHYATIQPGIKTGFNPFKLPKSAQSEAFLISLVAFMLSENEKPLNAVDMSHVTRLVKGNWSLSHEKRHIANLAAYLPQGTDNHLALRFSRWYGEGDLAWVFDCKEDKFPASAKTIGFDLTHILDEPIARAACLRYMFYRIESMIDGNPIALVLDEGWKGLSDPYVAERIHNWEKVIRKQNGIVIFGSQSARHLANTSEGSTIIEQSPTQIFYANPDADYKSHCELFNLTNKEFDLIKNQLDPLDRYFLIKQGRSSVIARLNLQGMDDMLAVLSGRKETVTLLDAIRKEHGNDPNVWIPIFHEQRKRL